MAFLESLDPDVLSDDLELILDPRLPEADRERFRVLAAAAPADEGAVLVPTSGTTGSSKLVVLSKRAVQDSATSVIEHLCAGTRDVWALALPLFHVGGLGVLVRSYLAASKLAKLEMRDGRPVWNPAAFRDLCVARKATLSALVPTQVFDLVQAGLEAPVTLRAVVVGGGSLDPELYAKARALGWRVLPSYGMTETASQVATASLRSLDSASFELPLLEALPHARLSTAPDGEIQVSASSLLKGYVVDESSGPRFLDPKTPEGVFRTGDFGEVSTVDGKQTLRVLGRGDDFVKVNGERVDLAALDRVLASLSGGARVAVGHRADARRGRELLLLEQDDLGEARERLLAAFHERVRAFERLIPAGAGSLVTTPLGKIRRKI
jgi:O-succinylbenzoic acid--CoA ligase